MALEQGTALVTGASAGIGKALAARFATEGHDVVLVARREDRLREIAADLAGDHGVEAHVVTADLSERPNRDDVYQTVHDRDLTVDYLVNNVGIGTQGRFTDIDLEKELDQVELNVTTPTHLTKLFGADMVERGAGGVLNVASTAAFQPGPYMAVYYASKAYVVSLSQALHEELGDAGVTVTALCPGPVATEFQERADNTDTTIGNEGAGLFRWQDADQVARAGYRGLAKGQAVTTVGLEYKALRRLSGVLPSGISRKLAADLNR